MPSSSSSNGSNKKSGKEEEAKAAKRKNNKRLSKLLCAQVMKDIPPIALGSLAMIASSLSNQAVPRLLGKLLDQKSTSTPSSSSASSLDATTCAGVGLSPSIMTSLAIVVLGGGLASFVRTTCLNRAQDRIASRLRTNAFSYLLTQRNLEWFNHNDSPVVITTTAKTNEVEDEEEEEYSQDKKGAKETTVVVSKGMTCGAILTTLNEDVTRVSHSLTTTMANLIRSVCTIGYSTHYMLTLNPTLFGLSVSIVPLIGSAAMGMRKFVTRLARKQRDIASTAASFAEERLSHVSMVKMSNREQDEVNTYHAMQQECVALGKRLSLANGAFMSFIFVSSSGALFMVFHAGGRAVAQGRMTAGDLTSFATYTFLLGLGTSGVVKALSELMQGMVSAERVFSLMDGMNDSNNNDDDGNYNNTNNDDTKEETKELIKSTLENEEEEETTLNVATVDSMSLHHVYFAYQNSPDRNVVRNVSFELKRGTVVALVGKNGSGKTTIASLLAALYQPKSGKIMLSGGSSSMDYNRLPRHVQTKLVQVVPQNPAIFNMTIMENVKYASPNATDEQAMEAMKLANCMDFVSKLEASVHYQCGPNGAKLSGGQRQRVGLARALLANPVCLVLDEPTSSLDAEGASAVQDAVLACRGSTTTTTTRMPGRALLLITHRAKTLHVADTVLVMKNGEIVETGDFTQLSNKKDSELCALMPELTLQ